MLCRALEEEGDALQVEDLAKRVGYSASHVRRLFRDVLGLSPKDYQLGVRAERLRVRLKSGESVTGAMLGAGYGSSSRLYEKSRELLGMTPTQFRRGDSSLEIRFAVGESDLGSVLVAATELGVCAVYLGEDPEQLVHELEDSFPEAPIRGADSEFEAHVAQVVGVIEDPRKGYELPLDIRGTAFQRRVWQALTRIPPGTTVSYGELAAQLGVPKSARAVGAACGRNEVSVLIPCHRVVAADGRLTGYRWGVARKRALLERELS